MMRNLYSEPREGGNGGAGEPFVEVRKQGPAVGKVGQRVGERHLVHLLEQDRVADHRCDLVADAVEHPPVIIAIRIGVDVVEGQRPDEFAGVNQRIKLDLVEAKSTESGRLIVAYRTRPL